MPLELMMVPSLFVLSSVATVSGASGGAALEYDITWKGLITNATSCPEETPLVSKSGVSGASIRCKKTSLGSREISFPAGMFDIDEQVALPANTQIKGNANPVDPADKAKEPDPSDQTYFIATTGLSDGMAAYCGTGKNLQPGGAEKLRIGFLLNSNTTVRHINFQGKDTVRPDDNGNLCGGAVFETPGCVSPGYGDGVGNDWVGKRIGCYDHAGEPNDLILGDGQGVENVLIDSVRLNGLLLPTDGNYVGAQGSQIAVWVAMTKDGSATRNITIRNLVSMLTRGDGINLHGNVQDSLVEDCHIENTGDDIYAAWGAYAENPSGNIFNNNVGKNPGVVRNYGYGVCVAIYGAKDVVVTGTKCYDRGSDDWNPGQVYSGNDACKYGANCNSALAIVHDGWFGAIYPDGNKIFIYGNEYLDMDGNAIPDSERPQVRIQLPSDANLVKEAPVIGRTEIMDGTIYSVSASSAFNNLLLCTIASTLVGLAVGLRRLWKYEREPHGTPQTASHSSACRDDLLVE